MSTSKLYILAAVTVLLSVLIGEFADRSLSRIVFSANERGQLNLDPLVAGLEVSLIFRPILSGLSSLIILPVILYAIVREHDWLDKRVVLTVILTAVISLVASFMYAFTEIGMKRFWP
jgi:hypothetical protein